MPVAYSGVVPLTVCLALTGVFAAPNLLMAQQRTPVPAAEVQEAAKKAAGEIYGARFQQAKTTAEKTALAAEMIEAAEKLQDGAPGQYVLLNIAADIAAGAGDSPTALQAIEALLERFDVPDAKLTAETLLTASRNATMTSQHTAVGEAALSIADGVADADEYEMALRLCETARSSAQKTRQFALAKDLTAKSEEIEKRQIAFQEYQSARAVLDKNPTDPAANLTAGRYLIFLKGDWDRGVPMLALGSDTDLKAAATQDLRGANSAEEQAAIGDAWWEAAETKQGNERDTLRLRAGYWYRQAEPTLRGGLAGLKIEQRLAELEKIGVENQAPSQEAMKARTVDPRQQLLKGTVLLMTFEPETFTAKDGKPFVADLSGCGNHGIVEGASLVPAGKSGAALQFEGKASVNLPTLAAQVAQGLRQLSVSLWVLPADVNGEVIVLDVGFVANASVTVCRTDDRFRFSLCNIACNSEAIQARSWYHVVGVWNGIDQRIYVNGELAARVPNEGVVLDATSIGVSHGARLGTQAKSASRAGRYFKGLLDEVAVFNRALSEEEIEMLFQLGKRGEPLAKTSRSRTGR